MHATLSAIIFCVMSLMAVCDAAAQEEETPAPKTEQRTEREPPASELLKVLIAGREPEVNLYRQLRNMERDTVETEDEARAICDVLKLLPRQSRHKNVTSELHALTGLFQQVESRGAYKVLAKEGVEQLCRIFDELADSDEEATIDDLLFVLKVLAMYHSEAGTDRVLATAKKPLQPDAYMWSVILAQFDAEHPHVERVLTKLREPLPPDFLRVALLDCANLQAINGGGIKHPFVLPAGKRQLQEWLENRDEEEFSYAHSAAASLPFISNPERDKLLASAHEHPSMDVQMEAAWAAAKLGADEGLKKLARHSLDPNHSLTAQRYLEELEREDLIPPEVREPKFQAKTEFAHWLAHPNELGRPPDELEIVDHRRLAWPPDGEQKSLWLIKYRLKDATGQAGDDVDCGLVGSITFCLFSYKMAERPPEDAYAIHCYWEMAVQELIEEIDVEDSQDADEYNSLLKQWSGDKLADAKIVHVAVISADLKYPQPTVALASAMLNGEEGWAVLDGERSAWYPQSEMPSDVAQSTVLKVHVGRRLLGLQGRPDRKKYLAVKKQESE